MSVASRLVEAATYFLGICSNAPKFFVDACAPPISATFIMGLTFVAAYHYFDFDPSTAPS